MIIENKSTACDDSAAPYSTFHKAPAITPYKSVDTLPHSACPCAENNDSTSSTSDDSEIRTEVGQVSVNFKDSKEGTVSKSFFKMCVFFTRRTSCNKICTEIVSIIALCSKLAQPQG